MYRLSAIELSTKFKTGELSAAQITQYYLERILHFDKELGAFLSVFSERALHTAKALDKKRAEKKRLGKLAGIPIAIKDNMHVKGELTTCGSRFLSQYKAPFSATVVELIESEDGIILGKTNLDEFAMGSSTENSAFHPTKNPWDLARIPGGSSGGSAAAVSARLVPIALGSDTGGSIRQPAALTGLVGIKPTYGRVSRYGLVAFGSSLDQIGPLATQVEDAALIMEVLATPCQRDSTSLAMAVDPYLDYLPFSIRGKKIGVPFELLKGLSSEMKDNFHKALDTFKNLGVEIVDVDLRIIKYSTAVYYILATAEASTNLARFDGIRYGNRSKKAHTLDEIYELSKQEGFGDEVKRRILLGTYVLSSGYQDAYYKKAQKVRTLFIRAFQAAFETCDLVMLPTAPEVAYPLQSKREPLSIYLQDLYTISANLAGLPAMSIPSGFSHNHLPFGIQLIGPQLAEAKIFQFAHHFQKELKLKNIPPLFDKEVL